MDTGLCRYSAVGVWLSQFLLLLLSCESARTLWGQMSLQLPPLPLLLQSQQAQKTKQCLFEKHCLAGSHLAPTGEVLTTAGNCCPPAPKVTEGCRTPTRWDPNSCGDFSGILCCTSPSSSPTSLSYLLPPYRVNFSWFSCLNQLPIIKKSLQFCAAPLLLSLARPHSQK